MRWPLLIIAVAAVAAIWASRRWLQRRRSDREMPARHADAADALCQRAEGEAVPAEDAEIDRAVAGIRLIDELRVLPRDIPVSVAGYRRWAEDAGLVLSADHLQDTATLRPLQERFGARRLMLALRTAALDGGPAYLEHPLITAKGLLETGEVVEIDRIRLVPGRWDTAGRPVAFGRVLFWFRAAVTDERLLSESMGKYVVPAFQRRAEQLEGGAGAVTTDRRADGTLELGLEEPLRASLSKSGPAYVITFHPRP